MPYGQRLHEVAAVAVVEVLPAAQFRHVEALDAEVKVPCGHAEQVVELAKLKVPGLHIKHAVALVKL